MQRKKWELEKQLLIAKIVARQIGVKGGLFLVLIHKLRVNIERLLNQRKKVWKIESFHLSEEYFQSSLVSSTV